jgi:hypothetical protein
MNMLAYFFIFFYIHDLFAVFTFKLMYWLKKDAAYATSWKILLLQLSSVSEILLTAYQRIRCHTFALIAAGFVG